MTTLNEMRIAAQAFKHVEPYRVIDLALLRDFAETFLKATEHNRPLEQFGMDMALAERERCAVIAESMHADYVSELGPRIAEAIRNQK